MNVVVNVAGAPVTEGLVLAYDSDGRLLGAAEVRDGRADLDPERAITLLARASAPAGGAATVAPTAAIEIPGPVCTVSLRVPDAPDGLTVWADPVELPGVDPAFNDLLHQRSAGVFDGRFMTSGTLVLSLTPGTWRIGGQRIVHDPKPFTDPEPSWALSSDSLEGDPDAGYLVDVRGDETIDLVAIRSGP